MQIVEMTLDDLVVEDVLEKPSAPRKLTTCRICGARLDEKGLCPNPSGRTDHRTIVDIGGGNSYKPQLKAKFVALYGRDQQRR